MTALIKLHLSNEQHCSSDDVYVVVPMDGGYSDVDIESKLSLLNIFWIRRFLDHNFHAWRAIYNSLFVGMWSTLSSTFNLSHHHHYSQKWYI